MKAIVKYVGDRVVAEANYEVCGTCRYCASGFYNLCGSWKVLGYWHKEISFQKAPSGHEDDAAAGHRHSHVEGGVAGDLAGRHWRICGKASRPRDCTTRGSASCRKAAQGARSRGCGCAASARP
ncbi:MAG: alcohol dehydrogenase catalytic domain-containing protein [Spirochaetes bacterium]|nr:alcohol dehydrogenase catalytic domain-containing protein [Spirochaetota bacterium]